ncbi:MAG: hypothetical protein ABIS06_06950 [Vicinamibacterales bacterium]
MISAAILLWLAGLITTLTREQPSKHCDAPEVLTSPAAFVECARAGTEKYRDRASAIADGYRRVGGDFPAMGEHWIRISSLFDGRFDAAKPEVLNYVSVDGKPRLLGVGYAVPLLGGETPPDGPGGKSAWHDHTRTIADETMLPHHHTAGAAQSGARLAMMHAWIWSPNPEGTFAADNWTLPFVRLGLDPNIDAPAAAAKALSLASGGSGYFSASIGAVTGTSETPQVRAAFARAQDAVLTILRDNTAPGLDHARVTRLAEVWREIWNAIDSSLSAQERESLEHLKIR